MCYSAYAGGAGNSAWMIWLSKLLFNCKKKSKKEYINQDNKEYIYNNNHQMSHTYVNNNNPYGYRHY